MTSINSYIDELITREMQPKSFSWWGKEYENVAPVLAETKLGDGATLMYWQSLDTRPYYHLIRVDSSAGEMNEDELSEYVELKVIDALEEEFSYCECADDCECAFPTIILDSGGWSYEIIERKDIHNGNLLRMR